MVADVRDALDNFDSVYLFSYENMRSNKFKDVRMYFRDSKIFMGKNKLLQMAMGKGEEDEYGEGLSQLSKRCSGSVGLLMTDRPRGEVEKFFADFESEDFARAGATASETITLTQRDVEVHPVSMIEQFRRLGVPVQVVNGKVQLYGTETYTICKEGRELNAEQCKLLVHFGFKLSTFKVSLVCKWSQDGAFEDLM